MQIPLACYTVEEYHKVKLGILGIRYHVTMIWPRGPDWDQDLLSLETASHWLIANFGTVMVNSKILNTVTAWSYQKYIYCWVNP